MTEPVGLRAPIEASLAEMAAQMEDALAQMLPEPAGPEAPVIEAMRYAALGGGKRIRAFLVLQASRLFGVDRRSALRVAAAVEAVHAYSLIHDDLPAMDDSPLRRGRPSTHVAFDEATAILAGDALQPWAFGLLCHPDTHPDPFVRCELTSRLAQAIGCHGMVGGQMIDLAAEGRTLDIGAITRLQRLKTGALIAFACEAGAIMGKASQHMRLALHGFAQDLGLCFQIVDDLLDVEGTAAETGKTTQADIARGKATFVSVLGAERARAQAELLAAQAVAHLDLFDDKADLLRGLGAYIVRRRM